MKALTNKQIQELAPAAFASSRDETRTSDRYHALSTLGAIDVLRGEGYHVTDAQQMHARKKDNRFTRHLVMLTHEDHMNSDFPVIPRVLMFNSHNGTTALRLQAGFYRFVCSNGLIVGETASLARVRHSTSAVDMLHDQLLHVAHVAHEGQALIDDWKKKKLTKAKMETFAKAAIELRVRGGESGSYYEPKEILKPRRVEDEANDLWTVFNRVQENLVQGGIEGQRESGRLVTLRKLTNIRRNTEFNQGLWELAKSAAA